MFSSHYFRAVSLLAFMAPQMPQPQTKVTLTQAAENVSELHCKCFSKLTFMFSFLALLSKFFGASISKAIKQRRPTTTITVITVNNQTKRDGADGLVATEGGLFALLRHFTAHLIFFVCFPSGS